MSASTVVDIPPFSSSPDARCFIGSFDTRFQKLKSQRDVALGEHDLEAVAVARKDIKKYKRVLRRMAKKAQAAAV